MVARLVGRGSDKTAASWSHVKLADYARVARHGAVQSGPGVGVVYVSGEIVDGEAGPGTAGGDTIAGLIEEALADKNAKALVVRVDSPGGSVMASERSEEHTSELPSLQRISYAVFCLKKKTNNSN